MAVTLEVGAGNVHPGAANGLDQVVIAGRDRQVDKCNVADLALPTWRSAPECLYLSGTLWTQRPDTRSQGRIAHVLEGSLDRGHRAQLGEARQPHQTGTITRQQLQRGKTFWS